VRPDQGEKPSNSAIPCAKELRLRVTSRVTFRSGLALLLALSASGALGQATKPAPAATPPSPSPAAPPPAAAREQQKPASEAISVPLADPLKPEAVKPAPDRGDFKLIYEKTANPSYLDLQGIFKQSQLLEETLKALNGTLALPREVKVALRECGTTDALYEPQVPRISICYELVDALAELFASAAKTQEEAEQAGAAVAGATLFIFLQETARALIDLYAIATPGRPDEGVDQLATLILLASGEEGEQTALNGAQAFLGEEGKPKSRERLAQLAYWKSHPFGERRFLNILCWVYGKNPAKFQDLVGDGTLPAERAGACTAEFQSLSQAWEPTLAPYIKKR
jgi:hypothetical protein